MQDNDFRGDHQEGAQPRPMSRFFDWVRSLGLSRSSDRWFAGVCAAVAHRTGVDAMLIRGIVVVAAIIGAPMAVLYLVAWAFIPDSSGESHVERIVYGRGSGTSWIVTIVAAFGILAGIWARPHWSATMGLFGGWGISAQWIVTVGIIALIIWALVQWSSTPGSHSQANTANPSPTQDGDHAHAGRQDQPQQHDASKPSPESGFKAEGAVHDQDTSTSAQGSSPFTAPTNNFYSAQSATTTPTTAAKPYQPKMRGIGASGVAIVFGLVSVIGAGGALVASMTSVSRLQAHPALFGITLAVLALGIAALIVAIAGRRIGGWSGWLGAVLCVILAAGVAVGGTFGSVRAIQNVQTTATQLVDSDDATSGTLIGNQTVNLADSPEAVEKLRGHTINLGGGIGNVNLVIPTNVTAIINVSLGAGKVTTNLPDGETNMSGVMHHDVIRVEYGKIVPAFSNTANEQDAITINIRHAIGDVELEFR